MVRSGVSAAPPFKPKQILVGCEGEHSDHGVIGGASVGQRGVCDREMGTFLFRDGFAFELVTVSGQRGELQVHDLANTINTRYKALVYVGALIGLRPGELTALTLPNLDLKNHRITVTYIAVELNGQVTFGSPKIAAARRTISIGQTLPGILTAHLDEYGPGSNVAHLPTHRVSQVSHVSQVVFDSPEGGPLRLTNMRRRQWKQAVDRSVGAPMRIHDLRHTHAALSIAQGVHPRVLQERLGPSGHHSDVRRVRWLVPRV